jgi:DNA polymerase III subunit beta
MKFTSTQENLNYGISLAASLAGRSVGLPILNNILLEVESGILTISSTNLEMGIKTQVRGKVEKDGSFVVNAKILADYVNVLPATNVSLELKENQLLVTCDNFKTKIRGQKADEFPIIPTLEEKNGLILDQESLKQVLAQTTFATSFDEMRPEINGVLFSVSKNHMVLVATDSYRLAEKRMSFNQASTSPKQVIIPLKTLQEVEKIIGNNKDVMSLFIEENQTMFKIGSTTVVSRLIEGNYPDYKQIIPSDHKTQVKTNKEDLIQATRAAALFTRAGVNDINLKFLPKTNKIEIKTTNSQVGEQQSVLDSKITGDEVSITFNYKYLLDGLQAMQGDKIILEINSANSPAILKDEKDHDFLYLIMPIKQ